MGVVVRRYIDFLILLIPTPLVSVLFYNSIPTFCSFFFILVPVLFCNYILCIKYFWQLRASHGSHMKAAHTVLYMKKHTQTYASYPALDISCMSVV